MNQNTEIDLLQILSDTVEDYFNIPRGQIKVKIRKKEIKEPRQIAITLATEILHPKNEKLYSKIFIATFFDVDHATGLWAVKTINNLLETDRKLKSDVDEIRKRYFENIEDLKNKYSEPVITKEEITEAINEGLKKIYDWKNEIKMCINEAILKRFLKLISEKNIHHMKMSMFFDMDRIINDLKKLDT
jgi:hypothetical protein